MYKKYNIKRIIFGTNGIFRYKTMSFDIFFSRFHFFSLLISKEISKKENDKQV